MKDTPYDRLIAEIEKLYRPEADNTVTADVVAYSGEGSDEGPDEDYPETPILMVAHRGVEHGKLLVFFVYERSADTAHIMWRLAKTALMGRLPALQFLPLDDPFAVDEIKAVDLLREMVPGWAYELAENDIRTEWRAQEARRFARAVRDTLMGDER